VTQRDKLSARLKGRPKDFTWDELVKLLEGLGYAEAARGKTGGSRRRFVHATAPTIALHKPHLTADNQAERAATIRMRKRHWGRTVGRA
jgi:hypothetical protein